MARDATSTLVVAPRISVSISYLSAKTLIPAFHHRCEGPSRSRYRRSDVLHGMRGTHECCLILSRRQPDALIEHGAVEARKCRCVRSRSRVEISHTIFSKEPGKHGAYAIRCERHAGSLRFCCDSISNGSTQGFELCVDFAAMFFQISDGRDAGGHGQRISTESSSLIDRP